MLCLTFAALILAGCSDGPAGLLPDDREALLTDEQLVTPRDPAEAAVDAAWDPWIRGNHFTVRSLTSQRPDDLPFLKSVIGSRRLVQLGESGHGVREFNLAKVRLIRFLHEEMGFDVIAFESGMFECWKANQLADDAPYLTMGRCTHYVWSTEEVLELFTYIRETRATQRPLTIAGVDMLFSNNVARDYAPDFLAEVIGRVDPAYASRVRAFDASFYGAFSNAAWRRESILELETKLGATAGYEAIVAFMDANAAALRAAYPADPGIPLVARQTALSRVQLMAVALSSTANGIFTARDRGMADNADFLLDRLYPGKKIILWAHNVHIMHDRPSMRTLSSGGSFPQSMGSFISSRRRADLYSIGLFMYRGQAADIAQQTYTVTRPLPRSLEATLYRARKQWIFVDMLSQARVAGTSWMFDPVPAKEWGRDDYLIVPRAQFDGILFIDTVTPPKYYVPP